MLLEAPIKVGKYELKNRIVVPPMADHALTEEDGRVNERHLAHYKSFAEGGAGLIVVEASVVSTVKEKRNTIILYDDECIPGLTELAKTASSGGAVVLIQLHHAGLKFMEENSIAEIAREKFIEYKEAFVKAACRCKKAGFHGVLIHAAHNFYLDQIIEFSNRDDEYGGSFENRVRVLKEIIQEIKELCGDDFLVSVRFGSSNVEEVVKTAKAIEVAGGDLLDVSWGIGDYANAPEDFDYCDTIYTAWQVKKEANLPVVCVGDIFEGSQAEDVLQKGYGDLVAVGRGHLCDPAWANKALAGEIPVKCRNCKSCQWFVDGRRCPVVFARNKGK